MKLLFLNLYSGAIERGAESFTHELIDRLRQHHQVDLVAGRSPVMPQSQFSGSVVSKLAKRLFLDRAGRGVLKFSLSQIPLLLQSDYDAVFPLNGFWQLLIVKLLQPAKGYKVIVTGHSGPGWDERWNLYLRPSFFVATTRPTLAWAKNTAPQTPSVLIPYAVDPARFGVQPAPLPLSPPVILCPAALVPYKRIDLAIRAVARLKHGSLLVLGQGPLKARLDSFGRQLLGDRFLLTSVPQAQIAAFYRAAGIVTLPSDPQENSPMVFLEALACGKPVVATDTPRNRWLLGEAAIYTDPTDPAAYARALRLAKSIPAQKISLALSKFTWAVVVAAYSKIIESKG